MKTLSKKSLALCVGAILGGAALVPTAHAVHQAADGLGDVMTNYYTTNSGNSTLINYTNTSDRTIAMRVRVHEYRNSRSWDFTVILSPYDVWNATLADGGPGVGPVIFTSDESCTIPAISRDENNPTVLAYNGFLEALENLTVQDPIVRIAEGYVSALVMGSKTEQASDADHLNGVNCATETARFVNYAPEAWSTLVNAYPDYTNNAIKGVFNVLNTVLGRNAATGMDTLADFFDGSLAAAPLVGGGAPAYPAYIQNAAGGASNLITLQMHPDDINVALGTVPVRFLASFFMPNMASANTFAYKLVADNVVGSTDAPVNRVGAQAVSYIYSHTDVINMWTARVNPASGWATATDLVVRSPVKQFFVDYPVGQNDFAAGRYENKPGVPPVNVLANNVATGPFNEPYNRTTGLSCDPVTWDIWDREENLDPKPINFSPAKWGAKLCFETNVITFNGDSALESPNGYNIASTFNNGWIDLNLRSEGNRYGTGTPQNGPADPFHGLPVMSWAFTTRDDAATGLNEAISYPSAYQSNLPTQSLGAVVP